MCMDKTATSAVQALPAAYGVELAQTYPDVFNEKTIHKAMGESLQWHRRHSKRPSPRWICYHGMKVFSTGKVELIPKDDRFEVRQTIMDRLTIEYNKKRKGFGQNETN